MIKIAFDHRDLLDKLFKYNAFHGFFVIKSVNLMLVTGCKMFLDGEYEI